jgi:hypothetical protein
VRGRNGAMRNELPPHDFANDDAVARAGRAPAFGFSLPQFPSRLTHNLHSKNAVVHPLTQQSRECTGTGKNLRSRANVCLADATDRSMHMTH